MAHVRRSGAGAGYPSALSSGAALRYEVEALVALPVGSAVASWPSSVSGGPAITPSGGSTSPTKLLDPDQLPYVAFNGVDNMVGVLALPGYAGTVLTGYLVMRPTFVAAGVGSPKFIALTRAGAVAGLAVGTFCIQRDAASDYAEFLYNTNGYTPVAVPAGANNNMGQMWGVYVFSMRVVSVDVAGFLSVRNNDHACQQFGAPGTPLPAFNFDRFSLGGEIDAASLNFSRVDIRACAVFQAGHDDKTIRDNVRFYARRYNCFVVD